MRENPVISDWVHISGGFAEGLLGGWLAQRQAALRGMLAAGARINFPLVYRACRRVLEHLVCHSGDAGTGRCEDGETRGRGDAGTGEARPRVPHLAFASPSLRDHQEEMSLQIDDPYFCTRRHCASIR